MLSIQEAAKEIFLGTPKQFYFFTGPDYGVKLQYINKLVTMFNNTEYEFDTLQEAYESLNKKTLIPRQPAVYIVRYDNQSASLSVDIGRLKFPGILISIIDDESIESKLDKKYSNNVIRFNHMTVPIIFKNLSKGFPKIPSNIIEIVSSLDIDFYEAQLMCLSLSYLSKEDLDTFTRRDIIKLFDYNQSFDELRFKKAILNRDYKTAEYEVNKYQDEKSSLIYSILSAYLEVLKCLDNKRRDSYAQSFVDKLSLIHI